MAAALCVGGDGFGNPCPPIVPPIVPAIQPATEPSISTPTTIPESTPPITYNPYMPNTLCFVHVQPSYQIGTSPPPLPTVFVCSGDEFLGSQTISDCFDGTLDSLRANPGVASNSISVIRCDLYLEWLKAHQPFYWEEDTVEAWLHGPELPDVEKPDEESTDGGEGGGIPDDPTSPDGGPDGGEGGGIPDDPTSPDGGSIPPEECPEGTTGTPPNCEPIPPEECPEGTTGTPPNCEPIPPEECPDGGPDGGGGGGIPDGPGGDNCQPETCPDDTTGTQPNCEPIPPEPNFSANMLDCETSANSPGCAEPATPAGLCVETPSTPGCEEQQLSAIDSQGTIIGTNTIHPLFVLGLNSPQSMGEGYDTSQENPLSDINLIENPISTSQPNVLDSDAEPNGDEQVANGGTDEQIDISSVNNLREPKESTIEDATQSSNTGNSDPQDIISDEGTTKPVSINDPGGSSSETSESNESESNESESNESESNESESNESESNESESNERTRQRGER